ncbi:MAG: hypothetical protein WC401_02190 [Bacteroidales bacterium]
MKIILMIILKMILWNNHNLNWSSDMNKTENKSSKPSKKHPWRTYKKILTAKELEDVPVITINSYSYGR